MNTLLSITLTLVCLCLIGEVALAFAIQRDHTAAFATKPTMICTYHQLTNITVCEDVKSVQQQERKAS